MYFYGSLMKTSAEAGLVFVLPNVAEYEVLINGLHITIQLGIRQLDMRSDSQLVIEQVMKESSYHDPKMVTYCQVVCCLEDKFDSFELNHIARRYNEEAD
jgi:ribonuclease HI